MTRTKEILRCWCCTVYLLPGVYFQGRITRQDEATVFSLFVWLHFVNSIKCSKCLFGLLKSRSGIITYQYRYFKFSLLSNWATKLHSLSSKCTKTRLAATWVAVMRSPRLHSWINGSGWAPEKRGQQGRQGRIEEEGEREGKEYCLVLD